jgi:sulfide:quinone oxidoreductase
MTDSPRVVVVGAGFAGLAAAFTLRETLPAESQVTVVSTSPYFVFAPSLTRIPFSKSVERFNLDLGPVLRAAGIRLIPTRAHEVNVPASFVRTDEGEVPFDRLVVATGGRPDTHAIPGLAGEFRVTSWIVGEDSAMELGTMLDRLVHQPGPLVVGAAPNATYETAAYELALLIDSELRTRGIRERVPMTFVTSEPYIGHLGFGQSAARPVLEGLLAKAEIAMRPCEDIAQIHRDGVVLATGEVVPAEASVIMPPFTGSVNLWKSAGLTDAKGLVPVDATYRHSRHASIYAAGIAARFSEPVAPLGTVRPPQTGYLSLHMGRYAALNLAASLGYGAGAPGTFPDLLDLRVIDGGSSGALLTSEGNNVLHHSAVELSGSQAQYLKSELERVILSTLESGRIGALEDSLAKTLTDLRRPVAV